VIHKLGNTAGDSFSTVVSVVLQDGITKTYNTLLTKRTRRKRFGDDMYKYQMRRYTLFKYEDELQQYMDT
jgi:hypothetical protein